MTKEEYKEKVNDYFKKISKTDDDYFFGDTEKNDVEFLKQRPVHPRDRIRRIKKEKLETPGDKKSKIKKENIILPTSHSINLIKKKPATKKKIKKENIILPTSHSINVIKKKLVGKKRKNTTKTVRPATQRITKKIKKELIDKYFDDQQDNVKFIKQRPLHPRNRKIKSQPKIKIDKSAKKYLSLDVFDIKFNNIQQLSKNDRVEYILDRMISRLPQNNNEFSIKHDPKTDTFTVYRDV